MVIFTSCKFRGPDWFFRSGSMDQRGRKPIPVAAVGYEATTHHGSFAAPPRRVMVFHSC